MKTISKYTTGGHLKTVKDILSECGEASAQELREQGWQGDGDDYNLGAFPGDAERAEHALDRALTRDERVMLEVSIRAHLDD